MNSLGLYFEWLSFGFCLSATAGGMLMLFRRKQTEMTEGFAYFQFFFILISVFGFYGLWSGQLLSVLGSLESLNSIARIIYILGSPFFVLALGMLLLWTCRLTKSSQLTVLVSSLGLFVAQLVLSNLLGAKGLWDVTKQGALMGIWAIGLSLFFLNYTKTSFLPAKEQRYFMSLLVVICLLYSTALSPLSQWDRYQLVFNILYFALHSALVVVYVQFAPSQSEGDNNSFDALVQKYGISKRELEVIEGIYAGQTNQEIANSLFITLQTVKDHTSRIYQKTFVKNRGQLVALVREARG
ncbi:MAG: LuxR C-terminal-related transcriptional regulator [Pseudohongiellaceae bacterium]|nr:LuxR C-terminal-related transcriptional regulator [Pseudohongiellaceae bacterium]